MAGTCRYGAKIRVKRKKNIKRNNPARVEWGLLAIFLLVTERESESQYLCV